MSCQYYQCENCGFAYLGLITRRICKNCKTIIDKKKIKVSLIGPTGYKADTFIIDELKQKE